MPTSPSTTCSSAWRSAPGAPINEDRLTRQLGIGRTPVREALKRLETERLVVIYPRRGSFATDIHIAQLALISDLRLQLEPLAARRAAERAIEAHRALCQRVLRDGLPALAGQDIRVLVQWDTGLHRLVYRCAGNSYLEATLTQYHSLASRIWYLFADRLSGMAKHVGEHAEVLTAIVDRDPDRAAAVVQACELMGVGFWFYSGDTGIATACYLHLSAATEAIREPHQSLTRWQSDDVIAEGPLAAENGVVKVPEGPGLGVTLDRQALERCHQRYLDEGPFPSGEPSGAAPVGPFARFWEVPQVSTRSGR